MSEGNTLLTREITIKNKASKSAYYAKNAKFIELKPQRLGGSTSAANAIKSQPTLLKRVMPILTGVDPSDSKWHIHLGGYLDSVTITVSTNGKTLNTSLMFDSPNDLKEFNKVLTDITEVYTATVKANPSKEKEAFKIRDEKLRLAEEKALISAQPINPNDYFVWRYALVHAEVANREVDSGKSVKIRFFIYDDGERKRNEAIAFEMRTKANKLYFEILDKDVVVKAILNLIYIERNMRTNIETLDPIEIKKSLLDQVDINPVMFMKFANDPNLELKAKIEQYIKTGILTRPANSAMIVNSENQEIVGHTLDEAIVFFKNENNKITIKRFTEKFNAQPK